MPAAIRVTAEILMISFILTAIVAKFAPERKSASRRKAAAVGRRYCFPQRAGRAVCFIDQSTSIGESRILTGTPEIRLSQERCRYHHAPAPARIPTSAGLARDYDRKPPGD